MYFTNIYILFIHQLYMVKLSQQLVQQEEDNGDRTRTERVKENNYLQRKRKNMNKRKKHLKLCKQKQNNCKKQNFLI